jgi:hypothetical protein
MSNSAGSDVKIETAKEYYRRIDAGRPDTVDLFTDDVEIYFPKFGVGKGKQAFFDLGAGFAEMVASIEHKMNELKYLTSGATVVVEGTTRGVTRAGSSWDGGKTPGGRFCSVFEFEDALIRRMYIYLDPDYGGANNAGFVWGERSEQRW